MNIFEWIKKHPLIAVGIGLAFFVLFYFLFRQRSSGDSGGFTIMGPSEAAINAGVAQSQISAQQQMAQEAQQANLQALGMQISGTLAVKQLESQTSITEQNTAIQGQIMIEGQRLSTQENLGLAQISAATESQKLATEAAVSQSAIASTTAISLANITTQGALASAALNADVQKSLAEYQSKNLIELAQINSTTAIETARIKGAAEQSSSLWGGIAQLGSAALFAFSDANLKTEITEIQSGVPERAPHLFSWRWKGSGARQAGYIAQDVRRKFPGAVRQQGRYLGIDFAQLRALHNAS